MHESKPHDTSRPFLSVVIPAFNEAARIGDTLCGVHQYVARQGYEAEVVLVDDGSADDTVRVARSAWEGTGLRVVELGQKRGKGAAIKRGMLEARGEHRLFSDADGSTPIEEIETFWPWVEQGCDVCAGSRALPDSRVEVHQPVYREAMGRFFNVLVQGIAMKGIYDTQCGFKLFSRAAAEYVFARQQLSGFAFDVECLLLARIGGFIVQEIPVRWVNSPVSRVRIVRDSSTMIRDLLRLRRLYGMDGAKGAASAAAEGDEIR